MWNKVMKHCVNNKLKLTRNHSKVLFLSKLKNRNVSTNDVECFVQKLTNEKLRTGSRNALMQQKILDAIREREKIIK